MTETNAELTSSERKTDETKHFRLPVDIKGLPYIFEGEVPEEPSTFEWSISATAPPEGSLQPNGVMVVSYLGLEDGEVANVDVKEGKPADQAPSIGISMITSEPRYLQGYENAEGVGSFLLDQVCALADLKKWRVYLEPVDKGGKLRQHELYAWYRRRGFTDYGDYSKELRDSLRDSRYGMLRLPQEADISQPITSVL